MSVKTLKPNTIYKIKLVCEVETKFGKTYTLTDSNLDVYWSNKKISDYIKSHNIPCDNSTGKVLFTVKTFNYKTFTSEDNREIKFLDMIILK